MESHAHRPIGHLGGGESRSAWSLSVNTLCSQDEALFFIALTKWAEQVRQAAYTQFHQSIATRTVAILELDWTAAFPCRLEQFEKKSKMDSKAGSLHARPIFVSDLTYSAPIFHVLAITKADGLTIGYLDLQ